MIMIQVDTNAQALPDFTKLWNYNDPAATEKKFRDILPRAEASHDTSYLALLLTQIARTEGLQSEFGKAHATLDRVEKMLTPDLKFARVRYLLERGRVFNSSDHQDKSLPLFHQADELAESIHEMGLAIDAIHMVAIAEPDPKQQVEWNLKGIAMVESDPRWNGWLRAFFNNIGESYLSLKDYKNAANYFHKLAVFEQEKDGGANIYTIKDEAKTLRLGGHPEKSLAMMEPVFKKLQSEKKDDGYIREELAEALFASGKKVEAKPHFLKAYELLSEDDWYLKHGNIDRLKELGK
jgi:tetratricopeptide (TPR) repeat protein